MYSRERVIENDDRHPDQLPMTLFTWCLEHEST
jgi:hypothetical protein